MGALREQMFHGSGNTIGTAATHQEDVDLCRKHDDPQFVHFVSKEANKPIRKCSSRTAFGCSDAPNEQLITTFGSAGTYIEVIDIVERESGKVRVESLDVGFRECLSNIGVVV